MAEKIISGPQKLGPLTPLVGEWEGNAGVVSIIVNRTSDNNKFEYFVDGVVE
ncbi:MAG TPA: hypothetical protein VIQ23_14380 [Hanamia sp.]